ncbi:MULTISPECIES: helix-turn-helix domain-containing protein [unclassified Adlercreutzia]|uniref:helix-turn-helix domain-containing protein n=1 Tax=unclassified Adlercreutzia TaxID=2636013 RepID=UPI0013EAB10B|nr:MULTISPECIES: helix-turn-helix domain-containing protein [unclassified Adlercreutzia]
MMGNMMHRGKGSFTHVENTVFFDHTLSLKAKGIYCQIRSLENNPDWVFTIRGFAKLVKDGVDAVTAGLKELESAGYIIRARRRSENGRFLKAEEATWITLDDPAMYASVATELKEEGYAILSEFKRDPTSNVEFDLKSDIPATGKGGPKNAQVSTRTGKSVSGNPVSGKTISGKQDPINYLSDKRTNEDKPLSCLPETEPKADRREEKGDFAAFRKGEFTESFEKLCEMSIKPVSSLKFKRDCFKAWKRKVADGYTPEQIIHAYDAYAKAYWVRNADDKKLAKNLIRWLEGEGGLETFADEPIPPNLLEHDGKPLTMEELADADPDFAPLWNKLRSARCVVLSLMIDNTEERPSQEELDKACDEDRQFQRCLARCKERYDRYLKLFELFNGEGVDSD